MLEGICPTDGSRNAAMIGSDLNCLRLLGLKLAREGRVR